LKKENDLQHQDSMWKGAPQEIFLKAKDLRSKMTKAESILWHALRGNKLNGQKFRRQHPLGIYIVDFYNHKNKLVIEIDGEYHNTEEQKIKDIEREQFLLFNGLKIIRFKNETIINNLSEALEIINSELLLK
jgi:very-short-patch-repair endonuclease